MRLTRNSHLPPEANVSLGNGSAGAGSSRSMTVPASRRSVDARSTGLSAFLSRARRNDEAVRLVVAALLAALCVVVATVSAKFAVNQWPMP